MRTRRKLWNLILLLIVLTGAGIFLYPTVSDLWNQYRSARLMGDYEKSVEELSKEDYDNLWEQAREYNAQHKVNRVVDVFDNAGEYKPGYPYAAMLDPNGDGLMGSIEIPKIKARLAIYHGLSENTLQRGAGHVEGTSLPIGGESTHAALAAHRGLPSAKLFTDLDQIEEGDIFYLHILDQTLAYQVDQVLTVEPTEMEHLQIVEGEDYVTLITCTPYGVNTHRLLVRGTRIPYEEPEEQDKSLIDRLAQISPMKLLAIGTGIVIVLTTLCIFTVRRKRKRRGRK